MLNLGQERLTHEKGGNETLDYDSRELSPLGCSPKRMATKIKSHHFRNAWSFQHRDSKNVMNLKIVTNKEQFGVAASHIGRLSEP